MAVLPTNAAAEESCKKEIELAVRTKLETCAPALSLAPVAATAPVTALAAQTASSDLEIEQEYLPTQDPPHRVFDQALRSESITIAKYRRASAVVKEKMVKHIEFMIFKTEQADYVAWTVTMRKYIPVMSKVWVENVIGKSPFYQREAIKLRKYLTTLTGDRYPMNYMLYKFDKTLLEKYPMDPHNLFMEGK